MFSDRQLFLLSYLASAYEELSGTYLSKMLGVSSKTIQEEIKGINNILKEKGKITYGAKEGYKLLCTDETKEDIIRIINTSNEENIESPRGNLIISVLAMEQDYISMEKIASRLNVSKSAISKELDMYWRIKRNIEISATKGLKLNISESKTRRVLSATFSRTEEQTRILLLKEGIEKYLEPIIDITCTEFLEDNYIVSGIQLREFQNYLLFTIVRNEQNLFIEPLEPINISNLMKNISQRLNKELHVVLSDNDMLGAQKKLNELNLLYANKVPIHNRELYYDVRKKLQSFIEKVSHDFSISVNIDDILEERFVAHMIKLIGRVNDGNHNKNFYKREINADNPFYAQILRDYFLPLFGIEMKDSEAAYIIMYLVAMIDSRNNQGPILLVSDMNPSMIYGIKHGLLSSKTSQYFSDIHVMPQYQYLANLQYYNEVYSIILTTENKLLFRNNEVVLIKKVLAKEDIEVIVNQLVNMFEASYQLKLQQTYDKYLSPTSIIVVDKKYIKLSDFLVEEKIEYDDNKYKVVVKPNIGFFPEFTNEKASYIRIYYLRHPITNRGYKLEYVIVSGYNINDNNYECFYDVLRNLFQGSTIKKYLSSR